MKYVKGFIFHLHFVSLYTYRPDHTHLVMKYKTVCVYKIRFSVSDLVSNIANEEYEREKIKSHKKIWKAIKREREEKNYALCRF